MGSILAMVAVVTVVAGVATVTTNKLHSLFSAATPKEKNLRELLADWRKRLEPNRKTLTKLGYHELDLIGFNLKPELKLFKGKHRHAGYVQTIYGEPHAHYVWQDFPKAKVKHRLVIVQTSKHELVYRLRGDEMQVEVDGTDRFRLVGNELKSVDGSRSIATREEQRDSRTSHVDSAAGKTLAIIHLDGGGNRTAPRLYQFVDVDTPDELILLEVLAYDFLLSQNHAA